MVLAESDLGATPLVTEMIDEDGDPVSLAAGCGATLSEEMRRAVERSRGGGALVAGGPPGLAAGPAADAGATAAVAGDSPTTHVWLACCCGPTVLPGEQVALVLGRDVVMKNRFALVHDGDELVKIGRAHV